MRVAVIDNFGLGEVRHGSRVTDIAVVSDAGYGEFAAYHEEQGHAVMDASLLGLAIDDIYNGNAWTRNVDGEQVVLPIEEDSADVQELLAILLGEVE